MLQLRFMGMVVTSLANEMERNINKIHGTWCYDMGLVEIL